MDNKNIEKLQTKAKELGGKLEKKVGKLIGNPKMQAEGALTEKAAKERAEAIKAGERTMGRVERAADEVEEKVGKAGGSKQMKKDGRAKQLEGKAREIGNR